MSTRVEEIAAQALALPAEDRARLAEQLLASFEPRNEAQAKWVELALRRRDEVRSGTVTMLPGAEAIAAIRSRIA